MARKSPHTTVHPSATANTSADAGAPETTIAASHVEAIPAAEPAPAPWPEFLGTANESAIRNRYAAELMALAPAPGSVLSHYTVLLLLEPRDSIDAFELDKIFAALEEPENRDRDVLLVLLSRGGQIEPAYQISKICRAHAKSRFVVAVPRLAKSAATLIALGADEIHMGPLGQLGPIDPQLGGLPALGVTQALETLAALSQRFPGSADMFARYLRLALTVEQIGYCDRVSASAVQYAERLLSTKSHLSEVASRIARELVYEYKDHGFVIDLGEAQRLFGTEWIKTATDECALAERIYQHADYLNLGLSIRRSCRALAVGALARPTVLVLQNKQDQ